jgi:glutathione S-transferase
MLKLYGFSKVNAFARGRTRDLRVLWALEEMQMPYEIVGMDHPAHDLDADAFHALSPFKQIPAIEDEGLVLTESAAILVYLAKKSKRLIPIDAAGDAQVTRWCFAALTTVEGPLQSLMVHDWTAGDGSKNAREFLVGWVNRVFSNLEHHLAARDFIATGEFTVADILMAHVLSAGIADKTLIASFPGLIAYRDRCLARPAWERVIENYNARVKAA